MPKTLLPLPHKVLPKTWLNRKPLPSGRARMSLHLTCPESEPRSPEKKSTEKKAISLANLNLGFKEGAIIAKFCKYEQSDESLSRNNGVAWTGNLMAKVYSSSTVAWYCLMEGCAVGFPKCKSSFQLKPPPLSLKIVRSLPILLSTVPAARTLGHEHCSSRPF